MGSLLRLVAAPVVRGALHLGPLKLPWRRLLVPLSCLEETPHEVGVLSSTDLSASLD